MQAAILRSMLSVLDAAGTDLSDIDLESLEATSPPSRQCSTWWRSAR
jgi:hypothetical protein